MTFYRFLTDLCAPLIGLFLRLRRRRGREDARRFQERLGFPSAARARGRLVWCHAASVGEMMSALTLLRALSERHKDWNILLTTGTVTSARMAEGRLPRGAVHHYMPVDRWPYVTRFLDHWRPDLALWIESELWPNMLAALKERGIPAALLNARMSEKSYRRWRVIKGGAKKMLEAFSLGLAQTGTEANRYSALGLKNIHAIGNLKYASDPLPFDAAERTRLKGMIGTRPLWLMASTHAGEEETALRAHKKLALGRPDLLTVVAPRHPNRGAEIARLIAQEGLSFARRAEGDALASHVSVYLADTMGEMGLFYRLAKIVCLAGSFTWGGHNPVEPAQLGCAVVFGPRMDNFAVMADDMLAARAARQVADEEELFEALEELLDKPNEAARLADAGKMWAEAKRGVLTETLRLLDPFFDDTKACS